MLEPQAEFEGEKTSANAELRNNHTETLAFEKKSEN